LGGSTLRDFVNASGQPATSSSTIGCTGAAESRAQVRRTDPANQARTAIQLLLQALPEMTAAVLKLPTAYLIQHRMKYILIAAMLLLGACDRPSPDTKIAARTRGAGTGQGGRSNVAKSNRSQQKNLGDAEGK